MTTALYTADGPLACLGSEAMIEALRDAADVESSLYALCVDRSGFADAGLADAAIKTNTPAGLVLGAALKSARIILPCVCWIDDYVALPERAVVNVETPVSVSVPGKTELHSPELCEMLARLSVAFGSQASAIMAVALAFDRMAASIAKLKIEAHFHAGDVKPIIVGGGDKTVTLESVEL